MLSTSVLPWLRTKRAVAFIAALALTLSVAFAAIGNSWTATAAPDVPAGIAEVVSDDMTLAGPSWTSSRLPGDVIVLPPVVLPSVSYRGPSWG